MPATNGGNGVIILVVIAAVVFIAYTSSVRGNKPSIPSSANVASVQVEQPNSNIDTPTTEQQKWREFWNSAYTDIYQRT
jgi:hypothetical protein